MSGIRWRWCAAELGRVVAWPEAPPQAWADRVAAREAALTAAHVPRGEDLLTERPPAETIELEGSEGLSGEALAEGVEALAGAGAGNGPMVWVVRDWGEGERDPSALVAAAARLERADPLAPRLLHGVLTDLRALEGAWTAVLGELLARGWALSAEIRWRRGVNDEVEELRGALRRLVRLGVRPYYLVECLWLPQETRPEPAAIRAAMGALRGWISGLAVPQWVREDALGRREPVVPSALVTADAAGAWVRDFRGALRYYRHPPADQRSSSSSSSSSSGSSSSSSSSS